MDYQQKYLKYKFKYLNLKIQNSKIQNGGAIVNVPIEINVIPGTQPHTSWLFMPLIYWGLALIDPIVNVDFPPIFYDAFEETIQVIPHLFENRDHFREWIMNRCINFDLFSRQSFLNRNIPYLNSGNFFHEDSPFHIPGDQQETILYENDDIRIFLELLTRNLIINARTPGGQLQGPIIYRYE